MDSAVVEPLDTTPTGPSEGNLRDMKEESSHEEEDEVSEEATPAKKYNKGILGTFHVTERARDKMLPPIKFKKACYNFQDI